MDVGPRREGRVTGECVGNVIVGSVYIVVFLWSVRSSAPLLDASYCVKEPALTLVRTLYSQLSTC